MGTIQSKPRLIKVLICFAYPWPDNKSIVYIADTFDEKQNHPFEKM